MTDQLVDTAAMERPCPCGSGCQAPLRPMGRPASSDAVAFPAVVRASRLLVQCGCDPIITAAAVQRAWLAERRPAGSTVPGAPDAFVGAVQEVLNASQ